MQACRIRADLPLTPDHPNDEYAQCNGNSASNTEALFRCLGRHLQQSETKARRQGPDQPFNDENQAQSDEQIVHFSAGLAMSAKGLPRRLRPEPRREPARFHHSAY